MNRKFLSSVAVASLALIGTQAQAASVGAGFNALVSFTPACVVTTAATDIDFGTYTSFGAASSPTASSSAVFKCPTGFTPTAVSLDNAVTAAGQVTGTLKSLTYTVGITTTTGSTAVPTAVAITGGNQYTVLLKGNMASGQAGTGGTADASTKPHTLYLIY